MNENTKRKILEFLSEKDYKIIDIYIIPGDRYIRAGDQRIEVSKKSASIIELLNFFANNGWIHYNTFETKDSFREISYFLRKIDI